jgi:integrase
LSAQTLEHLKKALSAICRYAVSLGYIQTNPAAGARLPRNTIEAKTRAVLTFAQAHQLINAYPEPVKTAVYLSMVCSLNVAEISALRRQFVNLGAEPVLLPDGDILPPLCLQVRENFYAGAFDTTKTAARRRIVPLTPELVKLLCGLMAAAKDKRPDALVFSNRRGRPLDYRNLSRRVLKPIAEKTIGHRAVSWHTFRHCAATFADWVQMPVAERIALMGHARAAQTLHYTHADLDRRRPYLDEIERLIQTAKPPEKDDHAQERATIQ